MKSFNKLSISSSFKGSPKVKNACFNLSLGQLPVFCGSKNKNDFTISSLFIFSDNFLAQISSKCE